MRTLCTYILCISGLCLGSLMAFPIQDISPNRGLHQVYNNGINTDSGASARFPETSIPSSRLDQLVGTYMNLLRVDMKDSNVNGDSEIRDGGDNTDYYRNMFVSKGAVDNYETPEESVHKGSRSELHDEFNNFEVERPKRQQGWYVEYGKRNVGGIFSRSDIDRQGVNNAMSSRIDDAYNHISSPSLHTTRLEQQNESPFSGTTRRIAVLSGVIGDSSSATSRDASDKHNVRLDPGHWESLAHIRNNKRTNQGWHTQYGKRSSGDMYLNVL